MTKYHQIETKWTKKSVKSYTKHTFYIGKHYASVHKKSVKTVQKLPKTSAKFAYFLKKLQNMHTFYVHTTGKILKMGKLQKKLEKNTQPHCTFLATKILQKTHTLDVCILRCTSVFYIVRPYFTLYVCILRCTSVFYIVRLC